MPEEAVENIITLDHLAANDPLPSPAILLDIADDDDSASAAEPISSRLHLASIIKETVQQRIEKMIYMSKKHSSAPALFKLYTLKMYINLREQFQRNPRIHNPAQRASLSVAHSVGRGIYYARQLRALETYIYKFNTLPPRQSGLHHAHPTLLNNEHILLAVRRYLLILANGEVSIISQF